MEVNLGKYLYELLLGNDADDLFCILSGLTFTGKPLYSCSAIRPIERYLNLLNRFTFQSKHQRTEIPI